MSDDEKTEVLPGETVCVVRKKDGWTFHVADTRPGKTGIVQAHSWRGDTFDDVVAKMRAVLDID